MFPSSLSMDGFLPSSLSMDGFPPSSLSMDDSFPAPNFDWQAIAKETACVIGFEGTEPAWSVGARSAVSGGCLLSQFGRSLLDYESDTVTASSRPVAAFAPAVKRALEASFLPAMPSICQVALATCPLPKKRSYAAMKACQPQLPVFTRPAGYVAMKAFPVCARASVEDGFDA